VIQSGLCYGIPVCMLNASSRLSFTYVAIFLHRFTTRLLESLPVFPWLLTPLFVCLYVTLSLSFDKGSLNSAWLSVSYLCHSTVHVV